jgi:hypothetical protein
MSGSDDDLLGQLELRIRRSLGGEDDPGSATKVLYLKKGPRSFKVATVRSFLSPRTGAVAKREFRVQTFNYSKVRGFADPERPWSCENEEIDALRDFLNALETGAGTYRLVRSGSDIDQLIEQVRGRRMSAHDISKIIRASNGVEGLASALSESEDGAILAEAVALHQRRQGLTELRAIVEAPSSTEHDIRRCLVGQTWIFGGRYIGELSRKIYSPEDVVDIPLLRNDGGLHIVELKKANIPKLIEEPRSHPSVGYAIHQATVQAANYLRSLDEDAHRNLGKYHVDTSRCSATVVVGHSRFVEAFTVEEIGQALRAYNSLLARVEVRTYDELIASAGNALTIAHDIETYKVERRLTSD